MITRTVSVPLVKVERPGQRQHVCSQQEKSQLLEKTCAIMGNPTQKLTAQVVTRTLRLEKSNPFTLQSE